MLTFKNEGSRDIAVLCRGGLVVVPSKKEKDLEPLKGWLTEERKGVLAKANVKMSDAKKPASKGEQK